MTIITPSSIYYTDTKKGDLFAVGPNWGEKSIKAVNNEAFVKGDLLQVDETTGIVAKCAANSTNKGKFCVAARPKATTDTEAIVLSKDAIDKIALVFDATVEPNTSVKPGSTSGNVTAFVEGTTAEYLEVGSYVGHGAEAGSGDNLPTNALATEVGIVEINPANWL